MHNFRFLHLSLFSLDESISPTLFAHPKPLLLLYQEYSLSFRLSINLNLKITSTDSSIPLCPKPPFYFVYQISLSLVSVSLL